jgi:hypothetical protein
MGGYADQTAVGDASTAVSSMMQMPATSPDGIHRSASKAPSHSS